MKQRSRKHRVATRAFPEAGPQPAVRHLTAEDRAALRSIGESGLFTLEAARGMYAGVRQFRAVVGNEQATLDVKPIKNNAELKTK